VSRPSHNENRGGVFSVASFSKTRGGRFFLAAIISATCIGCSSAPPVGDCAITADIACETAYFLVGFATKPDSPSVGDKCDNCGGTGKVGDGRVSVKCAACDGTGKKKKQKVLTQAPRQNCANGVCLQ
jgi:DnaJ-class molecular chaperone